MTRVDYSGLTFESDGFCLIGKEPFTGVVTEHWPDGRLRAEETYLLGRKEGKSREWNHAGQLIEEESLKNGVADGISRTWHENGRLAHERICEHGARLASTSWDADGTVVDEFKIDLNSREFQRLAKRRATTIGRDAATQGRTEPWREITYNYGNAHDPIANVGRFIVELSCDGYVHLTHWRSVRRDWRAKQTANVWPSVLAALERARFPQSPEVPAMLRPGTSSFSVSARSTFGEDASVSLPTGVGFDGYRELSLLITSIVGQTNADILGFEMPAEPHLITDVVSS
jgi:hypothetical protein